MRWTQTYPPSLGEGRVKSWFALLPVRIGYETRWLERVTVRQEYARFCYGNKSGGHNYRNEWSNEEFLNP